MKAQKIEKFLENATCTKGNRPVLTTIYKDETKTVSADGYRIHADYSENSYELGLNATKSSAKHNKTLEGRFPDVDAILNQQGMTDYKVTVNAKDLQRAVKLARVFAKDNADSVRIRFIETKYDGILLEVFGRSAERGDCATTIATSNLEHVTVKASREFLFWNVAFNGSYLLDMIAGLQHNETIDLNLSCVNPSFFTVPNRLVAIMPMQVDKV